MPFDTTQVTSPGNYSEPQPGQPCHPLAKGQHAPAIAYQCHGTNVGEMGHLRAGNGNESGGVPFVVDSEGHQGYEDERVTQSETKRGDRGVSMAVRRLTPL